MNIFLFRPDELSKSIALKDERVQHLIKVLHKNTGDNFFAGIIEGDVGTATITRIGNKTDDDGGTVDFSFTPDDKRSPDRSKPLLPITLIVGFPRPIQLRRLLRDVAGIGCAEVHLTGTELGDKNYMKSTLVERGAAEQMLYDGTVQAGSTHIPKLEMHKSLAECLDCIGGKISANSEASASGGASAGAGNNLLLALDNVRPACSLLAFLRKASDGEATFTHADSSASVAELSSANSATSKSTALSKSTSVYESTRRIVLAIGSERGWTERERDLLCERGFTLCGMGERILRTETAATAACAVVAAEIGW